MQLILSEAGQKIKYQANLNHITPTSLQLFLTYAGESLCKAGATRPPPRVANVWRTGIKNMIKLIRTDKAAGQSSRYQWGAADVLSSWVNDEPHIDE